MGLEGVAKKCGKQEINSIPFKNPPTPTKEGMIGLSFC